jgi:hypothetical protein
MADFKETEPQFNQLEAFTNTVRPFLPDEKFWEIRREHSFLDYLLEAANNPKLANISLALYRFELEDSAMYPSMDGINIDLIAQQLPNLDSLPKTAFDQNPISNHDLFLLMHDTGNTLANFLWDLYIKKFQPKDFRKKDQTFEQLAKLLGNQLSNPDHDPNVVQAYSRLLKTAASDLVIPEINKLLGSILPIKDFILREYRSALREFVGLSPLTFAEPFPLKTVVSEFIQNQKFEDKNTHLPVEVKLTSDSPDPIIYMDRGDLYRMLRNLLRDAVTHGTGSVIEPIIRISDSDACALLQIYSPGSLDPQTLSIISHKPYTTQDRGEVLHGYGKMGARQLLENLLRWMGLPAEKLLKNHWRNTMFNNIPHVVWTAPLPHPVG